MCLNRLQCSGTLCATSGPALRPRSVRRRSPPATRSRRGLMRPSPTASSSASGIEAAEVLACRSTVTTICSGGRPSLRPIAVDDALVGLVRHQPVDVARRSARWRPSASSTDLGQLTHRLAEHLAAFHAQMAGGARSRTGRHRHRGCRNGGRRNADGSTGCRGRAACPAAAPPCSTTAPAPSPNSTQVPRSFQSRMREKVSAPITSAVARLAELDRSCRPPPARR